MAKKTTNEAVKLHAIAIKRAVLTIEATSPMIQHQWSEKAKEMMRLKKAGKKTKDREACDPQAEAESATYRTEDDEFGIPVTALKASIIGAAHKDLGVEKTLVRKSLFIHCKDAGNILPIVAEPPRIREDAVRVGQGSADLRYRPEFPEWECTFTVDYDSANLTLGDIVNLVNRAGFGVGVGEWRPEKGGDFGRFQVKTTEE